AAPGTGAGTQTPAPATGGSLVVRLDQKARVQALDDVIARVVFALSAPDRASVTLDVRRAQFVEGKAAARFDRVAPGLVSIDVTAYDAGDRLLGRAQSAPVEIAVGATASVDLEFVFGTGTAQVTLDGPIAPTPTVTIGSGG
ncbi:MAG: hypothetical protein FJZ01_26470, partial [Candidatus Sericytochromatia bacterium]|nr:hypothetical protein [Candidatus Tanganyikabacteria bacterium]